MEEQEQREKRHVPQGAGFFLEENFREILGEQQDDKVKKETKEIRNVIEHVPKIKGQEVKHFGGKSAGTKAAFEKLRIEQSTLSLFRSPKPYKKYEKTIDTGETLRRRKCST